MMELLPYKYFYYPAIVYGLLVTIALRPYWSKFSAGLSLVIIFPILFIYILGMFRSKGVDHGTYRRNYDGIIDNMADPGYVMITDFLSAIHIPFQLAIVLFGVVSVISIIKLSKFFNIHFFPLFFLYFAHLFVGSDFSQLRIGLAMSVAAIAFVSNYKYRYVLYLLSGSIHLTILSFIFIAEYANLLVRIRSNIIKSLGIIVCILMLFLVGKYLYLFSFIDDRIDIYIKGFYSNHEGYGAPVHSYIQPLFHTAILIPFLLFRKYLNQDPKLEALVLIQIFGIANFFAFSDNGIFAYRLTSVILSLYPVLILYTYNIIANQVDFVKRLDAYFFLGLIVCLLPLLIFRPGGYRVINSMLI